MESMDSPDFVRVAKAADGAGQAVGVTSDGAVYTWGRSNALGQLGRPGKTRMPLQAVFANPDSDANGAAADRGATGTAFVPVRAVRAFAGGTSETGHTAIIDSSGSVWLTGCDRWQQLGLGSSSAGAAGYTWKNGALWQETFQRNDFLAELMQRYDSSYRGGDKGESKIRAIRDMALGEDHTLVLSSNKRDVFAFGKGGDGQLGLVGKPFVSAPVRSTGLSSKRAEIAAACAIRHCSLTLDDNGTILKKAGRCREVADGFAEALAACRDRSEREGLISRK